MRVSRHTLQYDEAAVARVLGDALEQEEAGTLAPVAVPVLTAPGTRAEWRGYLAHVKEHYVPSCATAALGRVLERVHGEGPTHPGSGAPGWAALAAPHTPARLEAIARLRVLAAEGEGRGTPGAAGERRR